MLTFFISQQWSHDVFLRHTTDSSFICRILNIVFKFRRDLVLSVCPSQNRLCSAGKAVNHRHCVPVQPVCRSAGCWFTISQVDFFFQQLHLSFVFPAFLLKCSGSCSLSVSSLRDLTVFIILFYCFHFQFLYVWLISYAKTIHTKKKAEVRVPIGKHTCQSSVFLWLFGRGQVRGPKTRSWN